MGRKQHPLGEKKPSDYPGTQSQYNTTLRQRRLRARARNRASLDALITEQLRGRTLRSSSPDRIGTTRITTSNRDDTSLVLEVAQQPTPQATQAEPQDLPDSTPDLETQEDILWQSLDTHIDYPSDVDVPNSGEDGTRGDIEALASEAGGQEEILTTYSNSRRTPRPTLKRARSPPAYLSDDNGQDPPSSPGGNDFQLRDDMSGISDASIDEAEVDRARVYTLPHRHTLDEAHMSDASDVDSDSGPEEWDFMTQPPHTQATRRSPVPLPSPTTRNQTQLDQTEEHYEQEMRDKFVRACRDGDAAKMMTYHLRAFQGCFSADHEDALREHNAKHPDPTTHYKLSQLIDKEDVHSTLKSDGLVSLADSPSEKLTEQKLRKVLEGRELEASGVLSPPKMVCTHKSECHHQTKGTVRFDCDSHFGWALDLSAFKKGLLLGETWSRFRQNMSNLHRRAANESELLVVDEELDPELEDHMKFLNLKRTKHIHFGSAHGLGATVFLYFPFLPRSKTSNLDNTQMAALMNKVILPALTSTSPTGHESRFPSSFRAAASRSTAKQIEARMRVSDTHGTHQWIQTELAPNTCPDLWQAINDNINRDASLSEFREPAIFFTALGHKYGESNQDSLTATLEKFVAQLKECYQFHMIKHVFLDLAKEVTPGDTNARTAFWRRCCMKRAIGSLFKLQNGAEPNIHNAVTWYNHCGLRDLVNATATPPKGSILARWGVLYCQYYSQIKQMVDTTKLYPFFSIDGFVIGRRTATENAKVRRNNTNFNVLQAGYIHSKNRINFETSGDRRSKNHSAREEYRMSLNAALEVLQVSRDEDAYRHDNPHKFNRNVSSLALRPFTSIKTNEYLLFFDHVHNARCSTLEGILALTANKPSNEQIKVLMMLGASLKAFCRAINYPSNAKLFVKAKQNRRSGHTLYGAGFSHTMMQYGFAWFDEVVKWGIFSFDPKLSEFMLFDPITLLDSVGARHDDATSFDGRRMAIERLGELAGKFQSQKVHDRAITIMVHLILRQFRDDVRANIQKDAMETTLDSFDEVHMNFTLADMRRVTGKSVHLPQKIHKSNKINFIFNRFFGDLDQDKAATTNDPNRTQFHNKPYRQLAWRAQEIVEQPWFKRIRLKGCHLSPLQGLLRGYCVLQQTIMPLAHPSTAVLTMTENRDAGGQRRWVAIQASQKPPGRGTDSFYNPIDQKFYFCIVGKPRDEREIQKARACTQDTNYIVKTAATLARAEHPDITDYAF